ncbi:MAG: hypothetical protein GX824_09125 [Clostridiales bacterium]|jgi:hypothetical protein|nr:hypothetical protein [Clostridiales bacterium]
MAKNKNHKKPAKTLNKAEPITVEDIQNQNEKHNTKKGSLGPNTKR